MLLLLFPTSSLILEYPDKDIAYSNTVLDKSKLRECLHYVAAAIFIGCLAFMLLFVFTRSDKPKIHRGVMKNIRNTVYITCGLIMICTMLVMAGRLIEIINKEFYDDNNLTFWMESIAVEAFGFSWLVKGESIFRDKKLNQVAKNESL